MRQTDFVTSSPQWALLDRERGLLIMRGSWQTVRAFGARFARLGIRVDYQREVKRRERVA